MNVLLYLPSKISLRHWGETLMDNLPKTDNVETYRTVKSLSRRLGKSSFGSLIAVLLASELKELKELVGISDQLSGIPLILILPDNDRMTISLGHRLFPRFISDVEGNPSDICAVLSKMLEIYRPLEVSNPRERKTYKRDLEMELPR